MVKLEKLSDRELALRMSKYIADLESIKLRAEYYSLADGCRKEKDELAADYARVRDSLREEAQILSFMQEKRAPCCGINTPRALLKRRRGACMPTLNGRAANSSRASTIRSQGLQNTIHMIIGE